MTQACEGGPQRKIAGDCRQETAGNRSQSKPLIGGVQSEAVNKKQVA
jgi:hypothetical protein